LALRKKRSDFQKCFFHFMKGEVDCI
jgi:hypothetical protein